MAGNAEQRLLDLLLEQCRAAGWRQPSEEGNATFSTHVLAKIRAPQCTLCLGQTMVYVLHVRIVKWSPSVGSCLRAN